MTHADRDKLVAILGMLGSDHAGERAAAGLAATNLLHKLGLTWSDVVAAVAVAPVALETAAPTNAPPPMDAAYQHAAAYAYQAQMNAVWYQQVYQQAQDWAYDPYANSAFGRSY